MASGGGIFDASTSVAPIAPRNGARQCESETFRTQLMLLSARNTYCAFQRVAYDATEGSDVQCARCVGGIVPGWRVE